MKDQITVIKVAVPAPLRCLFDYVLPESMPAPEVGARVRVPFGNRQTVGVVLETAGSSVLEREKLKAVTACIDDEALWPQSMMVLLRWVSDYYHHPIGEVFAHAMPVALRQGRPTSAPRTTHYCLNAQDSKKLLADLARAPLQHRIAEALGASPQGLDQQALKEISPNWRSAISALKGRGFIVEQEHVADSAPPERRGMPRTASFALNHEQREALATLGDQGGFSPSLLHGITGSGKTEVYLALIDQCLERGEQALVLVPEIGLTPQLVARFEAHLRQQVTLMHSGLAEGARLRAWLDARAGRAQVIIGTRSAIFAPVAQLGLIIVDEEHDSSFKQQDGLRYHARDVAVMRASKEAVPIVLGSATPSLESLRQVERGKYRLVRLNQRASGSALPRMALVDMARTASDAALSVQLVDALEKNIAQGEQSLVYLNRRGYAPVLMCYSCGWVGQCPRCDARLVYHQAKGRMRCHHCGVDMAVMTECPSCASSALHPIGEGTEKIEAWLQAKLPSARLMRIDRDTIRRKGELEDKFQRIRDHEVDIVIGTQMLAKGHDFSNITLVGVINADQGLYSSDFRGAEYLAQQVIQVAGRAGRADKVGRVMIQTWHPTHPVFEAIRGHDYLAFAQAEMRAREAAAFPPYQYFALIRAEAKQPGCALSFLARLHDVLVREHTGAAQMWPPLASAMERRAGFYRAQLVLQAAARAPLHALVRAAISQADQISDVRSVRWSVDIDPMEGF